MADEPFRLCVDLNVWVSYFLCAAKKRRGTASVEIVEAVRNGRAGIGALQLIVSHVMLTRLLSVLTRMGAGLDSATQFISLIENISRLGPSSEAPHLVLGGGYLATQDARMKKYDPYDPAARPQCYDPEDGRVIDTAIAAKADALVTANFRDFIERGDIVISPGRVHVRRTAGHDLFLIQPTEMLSWLRSGRRPDA